MTDNSILLSWTKYLPVSEGQDPLGLNLRVNARLASQLFHCITSITPRARYYSFLPWAVSMAGKMGATTQLRKRLRFVETAFAMSCVAKHGGDACDGGRLVGTENLTEWYSAQDGQPIKIEDFQHAKIPAFNAYVASLANLGLFITETDEEEPDTDEGSTTVVFTELVLSDLGQEVADQYNKVVQRTNPLQGILLAQNPPIEALSDWGAEGCLCALKGAGEDLGVLTDLFFNRRQFVSRAHEWRRHTLLLIMTLADQFADSKVPFYHESLGSAAFYGAAYDEDDKVVELNWPAALDDVVSRWKMFYFHNYLSAALENLLVYVVRESNDRRIDGVSVDDLLSPLQTDAFNRDFRQMIEVDYSGPFLSLTPADLLDVSGVDEVGYNKDLSDNLDRKISMDHALSEGTLLWLLEDKHRYGTPEAMALSCLLCVVSCWRFLKYADHPVGQWFAQAVKDDPYLNVTTPVMAKDLERQFRDPLHTSFQELLTYILHRYVIRLHQSLAYQKSGSFFYIDDDRIYGRGKRYDEPNYGNGRFTSAIQILEDLGLLEKVDEGSKIVRCTARGKELLASELEREA